MVRIATFSISIGLMLASTTSATFTAIFYNNCGYSIDVEMTAAGGLTTGRVTVGPGGQQNHPFQPPLCPYIAPGASDSCGSATMLFYKDDGSSFAAEYGNRADSDGVQTLWYDWSSDNGDPFIGEVRQMIPGAGCPDIYCAPGSDSCDYKTNGITSCKPDPFYLEVHIC